MSKKYVYLFSEGNANMRELLGGKGANLAEMTNIGMPVPQGFTISTEACTRYYEDGEKIAPEIEAEIFDYLAKLENLVGKKFGDKTNPLLVSVRSGARASMPGMMDTILNLGINDDVAATLAAKSGNVRWAYDSYRRFIMMFSDVAMGYDRLKFEDIMDDVKAKRGVSNDAGLTAEDMQEIVERFKVLYKELAGVEFPTDPKVQLMAAVRAVFGSLDERARHRLPPHERHPQLLGYRRQRPDDGVRQHGRRLRHRRRLLPRPRHRREQALRRVPDERPGRGRRRRHPHPPGPSTSCTPPTPAPTTSSPPWPRTLRSTTRTCRTWSSR